MTSRPARGFLAIALTCAAFLSSGAQDPRIGNRLDAPTRAALAALVDSARAQPTPVRWRVGAGPGDANITKFRRNVSGDIRRGAPPAAAAETRAKGAVPSKPDSDKPDEKI